MRTAYVGVSVMMASCAAQPPAGQPSLELRVSPSTTVNTTKGSLKLAAIATDATGRVGQGTVVFEPDVGVVSEASVELDEFGKAEVTYSCLSSVDPQCGIQRTASVLARWTLRPSVSAERRLPLRSADELAMLEANTVTRLDGGTGAPCSAVTDCINGLTCFMGACVGAGELRFSLSWTAQSDFDLYVQTPSGKRIFYGNPRDEGGELDVDSCVTQSRCRPTNVENIFWRMAAPRGTYRVAVENFNGREAGDFRIQVAGAGMAPQEFTGRLEARSGSRSMEFAVMR